MTLIPPVLRYAALIASIFAFAGCSPTARPQEPYLISATADGGAILTKNAVYPRGVASRHCAKYGKRYVLKDFERVVLAGKFEDRNYILYFDCS